MGEAALVLERVTKTYEYSHLGRTTYTRGVESLSLEVRRGEAFGLLGLNGSGKTTTFKLALGLLRPTSGTVSVLGGAAEDPKSLSRVGYLPELPYFYPFLTPVEALRFYGRLSGISETALGPAIEGVLSAVGLASSADRKLGTLSKGTVQRVGLAQALLHDPELVILDEPVSGLDPLAIKEFRDSLRKVLEKGKTIVISSHSISELERLCARVGILKDGKLVRTLEAKEWEKGGLEDLFVETVR
ncbi:MAG: ABC transporter ATP-binding protein [Elusimicrobia bacterium]|nr:ABC transporter ATP-binding protein [Elusimicrobiota bacterium]